jgi:D-methionine transport system substrate-binding protein
MKKIVLVLMMCLLFLAACSSSNKETTNSDNKREVIKVASLISPMTDILELVKPQLEQEGYDLQVIVLGDNVQPNVQLANKEIDANFFQHVPYMQQFNRLNDANLVGVQPVYFANYGVYAKNYNDFAELPNGATVTIANDATNIDRSLALLAQHGVITLADKAEDAYWTVKDITKNPQQLVFKEVDLLMLSRTYEEVDAVIMTPAYAKPLGLTPKSDALLTEGIENDFAITFVAREDNQDDAAIQALAKALTSKEVKQFLEDNYDEVAIPAFD